MGKSSVRFPLGRKKKAPLPAHSSSLQESLHVCMSWTVYNEQDEALMFWTWGTGTCGLESADTKQQILFAVGFDRRCWACVFLCVQAKQTNTQVRNTLQTAAICAGGCKKNLYYWVGVRFPATPGPRHRNIPSVRVLAEVSISTRRNPVFPVTEATP